MPKSEIKKDLRQALTTVYAPLDMPELDVQVAILPMAISKAEAHVF